MSTIILFTKILKFWRLKFPKSVIFKQSCILADSLFFFIKVPFKMFSFMKSFEKIILEQESGI